MRYYKKLLRAFLTTALVYTLLLNITFIGWYWVSSKGNIQRTVDAASGRISEYVDFQLQSAKEMAALLRASDYTQKYLAENVSSPDRYSRLKLSQFISRIYGVSSSHKNAIAVTKITDDYSIMSNSTGNLEQVWNQFHITRFQFDEAVEGLEDQFNLPMKIICSMDTNGQPYYTVICREWLGLKSPLYLLISYTEKQLLAVNELGDAVFSVLCNGTPVATAGMMNNEEMKEYLRSGSKKNWSKKVIKSSIPGFEYVYLVKPFQTLTVSFLLVSLAGLTLMSLSFVVMYLLTRRLYSPIEETLLNSNIKVSSENEFAEIRKAFNTLHSDVETMSQSLRAYRASVENKFFHDLFTGLLSPEQVVEQMRELGISQESTPFIAALIKYTELGDPGLRFPSSLLFEMRQRLASAFYENAGSLKIYRVIDLNFSIQGFIFQTADGAALSEQLRNLLLSEETEYGMEVTAYIGEPVDRLSKLPDSYRQAAHLIAQSEFSTAKEKVLFSASRSNPDRTSVYYPISMEQTLISAVIHGKTSVWQSSLRELMEVNSNPEKLGQLAFMLTATVNRLVDGVNESIEDFFPEGTIVYLEFRSCATTEAFGETAKAIFSAMEKHLQHKEQQSIRGIEKVMTDYLHQNFMRDIGLLDLADHLNMSKNYVSTLFKNLTGRNFKEYLSEFRYQKACLLLKENPDRKIRDLAEMVGCSPDILHRLFLRYGGITPSEFQRKCKEAAETSPLP